MAEGSGAKTVTIGAGALIGGAVAGPLGAAAGAVLADTVLGDAVARLVRRGVERGASAAEKRLGNYRVQLGRLGAGTAYEESLARAKAKRAAIIRQIRTGKGREALYYYHPGMLDAFYPHVIYGERILEGAVVGVTVKSGIDPAGKFCFIIDEHGNEMSVYKTALRRVG